MSVPVFEIDNIQDILREAISYCTEDNSVEVYNRIVVPLCNFLANDFDGEDVRKLTDDFTPTHEFEMNVMRVGLKDLIEAVKAVI